MASSVGTNAGQQSPEKNSRFANLSESERKEIIREREADNTRKATDRAVRTFRAYLKEKKLDTTDFITLSADELDTVFDRYFMEVRTFKGELYKRASFIALRHGLNRFLQNEGMEYDIVNDHMRFKKFKLAFSSMLQWIKAEGNGGVDHHPPLDSRDLVKLYQYLSEDLQSPDRLQEKVIVDVVLYFGRRGRENIRDLKILIFGRQAIQRDPNTFI